MATRGNIRFWTAGAQKGKSTFSTPRTSPFRHGRSLTLSTLRGQCFGQSASAKLHSRAYSDPPGSGMTAWQNRAKGDTFMTFALHLYHYLLIVNYLLFNIIKVIGQMAGKQDNGQECGTKLFSHKVWFVYHLKTHEFPLMTLLWPLIAHIFPLYSFSGCARIQVCELRPFLRSDTRYE